jgi:UDP-2,3-diacylglucosamine pyrophosphatase LpxH
LARQYFIISDMHMGGDAQLQDCDYTTEFIAFLKELEKEDPDPELLIVGDTFGFWELTFVHGVAKLDHIIRAHQAIFDQFRATGARIKVTMMVGNHDYDLACEPAFADGLRAYNIHLDSSLVLTRTVGGKKIWIEHGQQRDEFNAFPAYGKLHALLWDISLPRLLLAGPAGVRTLARAIGSRIFAPWTRCRFPTG